ncbi:MAG: hypothetical protein HC884_10965 [Chloroflexaceae bacterium]|nr:hypothetical protein [Chloroflexaceae bacterium]
MPPQPHRPSRRHSRRSQHHAAAGGGTKGQAAPSRSPQQRRFERPAPKPVDYSQDYAFVRRDLKRIAIWSSLLMVGMFAAYIVF